MAGPNWDERYSAKEFAYGTEPNVFFASELGKLSQGRALFAAEGEGRNAVYAAQKGWTVDAFDMSVEGKKKAEQLAKEKNVSINDYQVVDVMSTTYGADTFDLVVFVYSHFPAEFKKEAFRKLSDSLKKGGTVVCEVFRCASAQPSCWNPTDM
eukprot:TRINITY_DN66157_c5_g1_i1.p1 TRINITY_DN66157_c5_g1~~TRINITY_DN66157_c5_g1_i1.p1  ORF type:complete len:153 (-),score=23.29 TRINITY_DN66157_c5_g1_i1:98-556(-)